MPFKQKSIEPLLGSVNVRLTASEKARLKSDADLAAISMSELIRNRYLGLPIVAKTDVAVIKELRRIGALLKHLHNESGGQYGKASWEALGELRRCMERLSK